MNPIHIECFARFYAEDKNVTRVDSSNLRTYITNTARLPVTYGEVIEGLDLMYKQNKLIPVTITEDFAEYDIKP